MQASEAISSSSMRYISENIHLSIFPQSSSSSSSQLYGLGFCEAVSDNPLHIDTKLNAYENSFYMDTKPHHIQNCLVGGGVAYSQSPFLNHPSGPSSAVAIPSFGSSHFTHEKARTPAYESQQQQLQQLQPSHIESMPGTVHGSRKRPIEDAAGGNSDETCQSHPWTTTTKKMAMSGRQEKMPKLQLDHPIHILKISTKDVQKDSRVPAVPPRRSQKLSDKITALQKLVSPYGKTDTASVLHEASVFIKVLLDQIENSFHSSSSMKEEEYAEAEAEIITAERGMDLRGRGFCLVPASLTKTLVEEDPFNHLNFCTTNLPIPLPAQKNTSSTHHF